MTMPDAGQNYLVAGDEQGTPVSPKASGAEQLVQALERAAVDVVFGIPGGAILPAYDALLCSQAVRHVLVRHEQGAGHAAEGFARATGRVGVCVATSGPGATNLVTPLANARLDSTPLVAITGQVPSHLLGTTAFQEVDIAAVVGPVTKGVFRVTRADQVAQAVTAALNIALEGRPGPVLVDITKDALQGSAPHHASAFCPDRASAPDGHPRREPDPQRVRQAGDLLRRATRPVLYAGGGTVASQADGALRELAELLDVPVVTTLMARGILPDDHPLNLGMPGMHGTVPAVMALQRSDLILAVGARFDDRVTGRIDTFAPGAEVIHIDIDPTEIGKLRHAHVALHADARAALTALTAALQGTLPRQRARMAPWWRTLQHWRTECRPGTTMDPVPGTVTPQAVFEQLAAVCPEQAVFTTGVGQHQMWAAQLLPARNARCWITSGGAGTMGFAIPAAMGAKIALPTTTVWAIDGDGCFQMTSQELITCATENIPIKVAVLNNGSLGMVRQWQSLFYAQRYSATTLGRRVPDIAALAQAMGCVGLRCTSTSDIRPTLEKAMAIDDVPVVVDFAISADDMVWPMVPAGASNDDILIARGTRPDFGDSD
ncbi:biosynthetic-type acetolactate synthase large subunit [Streptomyces sp. NPDC007205]|uniref:biosynthetic-type acetolactate synthase large subunit n=1 Tax=Streptomyces sp. NPDC007205 TaxID=3154316 RepID=UPI0033E0D660